MIRIGVISDTHGYLDPKVCALFAGVDHILHAGDIGPASLLVELGRIAPVTAVAGNCDSIAGLRETEVVALGGHTFVLRHIVDVRSPGAALRTMLRTAAPDVVVFGHSHKRWLETRDGVLFFNPGCGGRRGFAPERSVGILHCDADGIRAAHHELG